MTDLHRLLDTVFSEAFNGSRRGLQAAFCGTGEGIGRETHKMMLDDYQLTKNMLVSHRTKALGFF